MSRLVTYTLILLGVYFLCDAAYDEHRGIAVFRLPTRNRMNRIYTAKRDEYPKMFRNLMTYEWFRGSILICGGLLIFGICRRADRTDPLSEDFAGTDALDELDKTLDKEQQQRNRNGNAHTGKG